MTDSYPILQPNGAFTVRGARLYCLNYGIRTIGADFWGGGDNGSLDGLTVPANFGLGLDDVRETSDGDPRGWLGIYSGKDVPLPPEGVLLTREQACSVLYNGPHGLRNVLTELLDKALVKYSYDWYNNDGGGGALAVDLKTLDYFIDGYTNETVQHDAPEGGNMTDADDDGDFLEITESYGLLKPAGVFTDELAPELTLAELIAKELDDGA